MGWTTRILIVSLLGLAACQQRSISGGGRRRQRISASKSSQASFNCPQDFGYYPHPTDCTQYYVCVFGGALQESCTGGLVYSHELETCDWPRNVDCNPSSGGSGVSTVKVTDPRTQSTSSSRAATEALTPSVGSFDPRFDHTFSSSQTHHTARPFEDGDRSGNQRALFRQSTSPKQQALTSSHFSQQAFFDTPVAEQNGRRSQQLIAKPVTVRPQVFRWQQTQSPQKKTRRVREAPPALSHQRDLTPLDASDSDSGHTSLEATFLTAATARFGLGPQHPTHNTSPNQEQRTFAAETTAADPFSRTIHSIFPNPFRPDQGFTRRQLAPQTSFFQQGFFPRFPTNRFGQQFRSPPRKSSPASAFGNFQSFNPFSAVFDTQPFSSPAREQPREPSFQQRIRPHNQRPRPQIGPFFHRPLRTPLDHMPTHFQPELLPLKSLSDSFPESYVENVFIPGPDSEPFIPEEAVVRVPSEDSFDSSSHLPQFPSENVESPKSTEEPYFEPQIEPLFSTSSLQFPPPPPFSRKPQVIPPDVATKDFVRTTLGVTYTSNAPRPFPTSPVPRTVSTKPPVISRRPSVTSPKPHVTSPKPHLTSRKPIVSSSRPHFRRTPVSSTPSSPVSRPTLSDTRPVSNSIEITDEQPTRIRRPNAPVRPSTTARPLRHHSSTFPPFSKVRNTAYANQSPKVSNKFNSVALPPQVPGTVHHPELSKLPVSNPKTSDSAQSFPSLHPNTQDSRQPLRPTTVRSLTALRPTQPASPHSPPLVNDNNYTDLNFTDNDFLYYYDDLLYDYYDPNTQTAPTTQQPVHRPAATHSPIRDGITKAFEISDFDFDSTRPVSSFSFSGIPDPQPPTLSPTKVTPTYQPQPNRQHKQSHNARVESDSRSASHSPSSLSFSSSPSQSSVFSHSQPSDVPQSAPPPHFARIPAIGNAKTVHSQEQGSSFSQSASQALRALSNIPTAFPETLSDTPDDTPIQESFSSSSSSRIPSTRPTLKSLSSQSSSTNSGSSRSSKNPSSRSNTRQPNSNRSPPRESSTPSLAAVDSSVPKRSSRITLKPVSVLAPSAPSRDIWRFPPRRPAPQGPTPPVDTKATKCDPKLCRLPDCYCGGRDIPGGYDPVEVPQIVLLTFDDAVNDLNNGLYRDLFEVGRKNPNNCPITSTMYVSHEWTDYSQVQDLYADGHEMASHSVSHSFGEQFSTKKWAKEIAGQREILSAYGGVKMEDVRGMRAPFLAVGGNKMYRMLWQENFTYDSSMPVYENNPPSWPYTLDYRIFHDCMIPPCPTNSYPGLWQVPMVMWQDLNGGRCSMGDACTTPPDAEGVYKMLIKNFERHYTTNRAPFGLFYHAAWFTTPHHKEGFIAFLDTITAMDDVWLTTNWQLIQWLRDPTPLSRIKNFAPFSCNYSDRPKCTTKKVCNVWHKGGVRYMRTCQPCPETYPWTGNTGVNSPLNDP
ncbi:melanoma-associated antigen C1 isoform X10 [Cherax quadricarinatus]|uniref:melanoma-associated antigen C1 isoform X10 n=1 Tax=Cherax quadricarinatus TaxID=27406 RepID=UPI00387E8CA2